MATTMYDWSDVRRACPSRPPLTPREIGEAMQGTFDPRATCIAGPDRAKVEVHVPAPLTARCDPSEPLAGDSDSLRRLLDGLKELV